MAISRERAVDLSHKIMERLTATPGVVLPAAREATRARVLQALLDWDREIAAIEVRTKERIREKSRRTVEGSREWDLLYAEELTRALADFLGRGE
jgi:hypothetical protein